MQQDYRSVAEFYSDLKILWEELEIAFPFIDVLVASSVNVKLRVMIDNITPLYMQFNSLLV